MTKLVICGAGGRMGRENTAVFFSAEDIQIVGAVEAEGHRYLNRDAGAVAGIENIGIPITSDKKQLLAKCDVCVDFSTPEATLETVQIARTLGKGMVIGTTGFTADQIDRLHGHTDFIPILLAPNMSQGVNILVYLAGKAAELLGEEYEVEITEIHHNRKKDAPSGTALQFGEAVAGIRNTTLKEVGVFGRNGMVGERRKGEIGFSSVRISDVVGEHTVMFGGPGERIELTHRSSSRRNYANGALRAVRFIARKEKGFFSMKDVLGIP
jgi:4-hydroxy-tetrahydrodipicolinate reductase